MAQLIVAQGLMLRVHVASAIAIVEVICVISGIILYCVCILIIFLPVASVPIINHCDVSLQARNAWIILSFCSVLKCEQPLLGNQPSLALSVLLRLLLLLLNTSLLLNMVEIIWLVKLGACHLLLACCIMLLRPFVDVDTGCAFCLRSAKTSLRLWQERGYDHVA